MMLAGLQQPDNIARFTFAFPHHVETPLPGFQQELFHIAATAPRAAIAAPRGSGKSTTVNLITLAYKALFRHSPFSILLSDTTTQATQHLETLKNELESNPYIRFLFGDVRGDTWGANALIVNTRYGESLILPKGAGQKIRGLKFREFRPTFVAIDDLENEELVESAERRTKLANWLKFNVLQGLAKDNSQVLMTGTILHENSLLNTIIEKRDPIFTSWVVKRFQAILNSGQSYWPERFPIEELRKMRDDPTHPKYCGSIVFSQEYQNIPVSDQDRIIKESWLKYYKVSNLKATEDWEKGGKIIGGVDPAISKDDKSSNFSFTTLFITNEGKIKHLETITGKFDFPQQIQIILDCYSRWKHDNIGIESIAYQKALKQMVGVEGARQGIYPRTTQIFTDKDKRRRLIAHSAKFEGGFVELNEEDKETANLVGEILAFPAEPNDRIDSFMLALETAAKPIARTFRQKPSGL